MVQRYLNNPAATAAVIDAEGWLNTGDTGCVSDDLFLKVVDREKDIIKTSAGDLVGFGMRSFLKIATEVLRLKYSSVAAMVSKWLMNFQVSPSMLENALIEDPRITHACVLGAMRQDTGLYDIAAFVSSDGNGSLTPEGVKDIVRKKFNATRHLTHAFVMEELPLNNDRKIDKKILRAKLKELDQ